MKRSVRMIYSALSLILMNAVFWVCNYYPRHIIEWGSPEAIVAVILNIIYFVLNGYILISVFKENKAPFFELDKISPKAYASAICALIGIQLAFEIANTLCIQFLGVWGQIATDALMIAYWTVIYVFLTRHNDKVSFKLKGTVAMVIVLALLMGASVAFDLKIISDYTTALEKYTPLSPYIMAEMTNADFLFGVRSLIFESAIALTFVVYHFLSVQESERENKRNKYVFLRIAIILFGATAICALKYIIYPEASMKALKNSTTETRYYEGSESVDLVTDTFTAYRTVGRSDGVICYRKSETKIYDGDRLITQFDWISLEGDYTINGNQMSIRDRYEEITVDGKNVRVIEGRVIYFYENGNHKVVKFDQLAKYENNDTVIGLCEQMLRDGNVSVFEYACEYLMKYDESFIAPYIERYANGEFNENELKWMSDSYYRSEYITDIARNNYEKKNMPGL